MSKTKELYSQTVDEAMRHLESLVRTAFKKDSRLIGFVLAMGSATFETRKEDIIDDSDAKKYPAIKPAFDFLDEWDEYLHLSGAGVWWKCDGTTLTEW